MFVFHDKAGRAWEVEFTLGLAQRIESHAGLSLLTATDAQLGRLVDDLSLLVHVAWLAIEPQAQAAEVSQAEWAESMNPKAIGEAQAAVWSAVGLFFQTSPTFLDRWWRVVQDQSNRLPPDPPGTPSTDSPVSSAGTGDASASGNSSLRTARPSASAGTTRRKSRGG